MTDEKMAAEIARRAPVVMLRLTDETERDRIDRHVERMRARTSKVLQITRTDAIRDLVLRGLVEVEREP